MIRKKDGKSKSQRVVITGLGVVSSLGIGWEEFWKNLLAGKSGITKVKGFDTSPYMRHYGGEVKNFDPCKFMSKNKAKVMGKASQMSLAAAKLALKDGKLNKDQLDKSKTGVYVGTTTGEIQLLEQLNDEKISYNGNGHNGSSRYYSYPSSSLSNVIAKELKITSENSVFATACSSGNYSIAHAFDKIQNNEIEFALVGGADAFSRIVFTGFNRLFAVAVKKCSPFDKNRKGMIPGEGAGILLIESYESAKKRGAKIYAELLGYGLSCDAHHMTNPSVEGVAKAMKKAMQASHISPDDVDYVSAHGTGTKENDKAECEAIASVFNSRSQSIPVSSIKSMLGHTMGAASAFESIAGCLAIHTGKIPPTINFKRKDPECPVNCVPNKYINKSVAVVINNAQAFGGNNACVVFKNFSID